MKQQQPTPVARPQWLADHPRLGEDILDTRVQQPDHGATRRSYVAPESSLLFVDTSRHFLDASFTGGGGHTPGGQHDDIDDDPVPGPGGGGHTPGGQHDDIEDGKFWDFEDLAFPGTDP